MKEVFTKSFWKDVKKTFEEAQEDPSPAPKAIEAPGESSPSAASKLDTASKKPETTSPPPASSDGQDAYT